MNIDNISDVEDFQIELVNPEFEQNLNDFDNIATLHQNIEASEKERTSVLNRRNARRELLHRKNMSDDDVEASSSTSKPSGDKDKDLFNGLISDPSQIKKRNNKFQMTKKNLKRRKRK